MRLIVALRRCLRMIPVLSALAGGACLAQSAEGMKRVNLPALKPVALKPYAALEIPAHLEPSGLVKSRRWPDVYWTHNDSGDGPRIFPVHRDGRIYPSARYGAAHGVHIPDAVNVDWEDITADDQGHLIIGDFGNSGAAELEATGRLRSSCVFEINGDRAKHDRIEAPVPPKGRGG